MAGSDGLATLVAYDEDSATATVVWHGSAATEQVEGLFEGEIDAAHPPVVAIDDLLIEPTGRTESRFQPEAPKKGNVKLGGHSFTLSDLADGLNTGIWDELELGARTFALDDQGSFLYVVDLGDREKLTAWISDERARRAAAAEQTRSRKEAEERAAQAKANRGDEDRFVNPYTFVELPEVPPVRSEPSGHHQLAPGRLAGTITVRWKATSPLLIGDGAQRFPRDAAGSPIVPGSGIKGAVRSLHETLTGSCLRVVDHDFVPSYREPVGSTKAKRSWTIAVVEEVDEDGRPLRFDVADEVRWIRHDALIKALPDLDERRTGRRVGLGGEPRDGVNGRKEVVEAQQIRPEGDEWVLLLSDAAARKATRIIEGRTVPASYFASAGRLARQVDGCTDRAWEEYRILAAGTDDARRSRAKSESNRRDSDVTSLVLEVTFTRGGKGTPREQVKIGFRQEVATSFRPGDVIWVLDDGAKVTDIKRSSIWRRPGDSPLAERMPAGFSPCRGEETGPNHLPILCPSCRLFGSADAADPDDKEIGQAQQRSYRGHVRFEAARPVSPVQPTKVHRPALSAPRPGSGQFYLRTDDADRHTTEQEIDTPLRQWGSRLDTDNPRPIRGRKFYWHGDPGRRDNRPRTSSTPEADRSTKLEADVEVLPAGTTLETTIHVDNLSPEEIGGLLASIHPALALDDHRPSADELGFDPGTVAGRLGGGRPLGYGTVEVSGLEVVLHDSTRYSGGIPGPHEARDLIERWAATVEPAVKATWASLAASLSTSWVEAVQLKYPSLEYFGMTAGVHFKKKDPWPLVQLPDAPELDQTLEWKAEKGGGR